MARWALIRGGVVTTVVVQDAQPTVPGIWRDVTGTNVAPGWVEQGANLVPPPAPTYALIRTEAFWERFTNAELLSYDVAMQHDPAATLQAKRDAARLRIFKADAQQTGFRRLAAAKVVTLVNSLEPLVIDVGRAAVILNTPITAAEAYNGVTT